MRRAYSFGPQDGPRQAIAIRLDEKLKKELQRFIPPPYLPETVPGAEGLEQPEKVHTAIFLEFLHRGRQYLYVLKRRDGDGAIVPGRKGSFVLIPGAIQEHTVVLDPQGRTVPEPMD